MSHFITLVFTKENGSSVEDLLEPYYEGIEYEPYVRYTKEQAIAETKKDIENYKNGLYAEYLADPVAYEEKCNNPAHINYIKNEFPKKLNWTDEECYEDMKKWYDEDMIDDEGNLLSTYNPNSKWDWYVTGGRWSGYLLNKSGEHTDEDYASEIVWNEDTIPFAYVTPDGEWYEKGEMLYWAMVKDEKEEDVWNKEFIEFINSLDDDVIVTAVDCHI